MNISYPVARATFSSFRAKLEKDGGLRSQLESAVKMLRSSYNTAIYENRFIVGGALEHIMVAAFNGAGIPAQHVGRGDTRVDVLVTSEREDAGYSVKASFSTLSARLINTMGNKNPEWKEPSLFLFSGVGIVYADPELLPEATIHGDGVLTLDGKKMRAYITSHPEYVLAIIFDKPKTGKIASSKTASEDVARNIVHNFPKLSLP
ncbi:MAG TPA: hypothetical protein VI957_00715 [Candidatus Paceibacterota bacterium]